MKAAGSMFNHVGFSTTIRPTKAYEDGSVAVSGPHSQDQHKNTNGLLLGS